MKNITYRTITFTTAITITGNTNSQLLFKQQPISIAFQAIQVTTYYINERLREKIGGGKPC
ncbi:MAG: hypothetical protein CW691_04325 [Candidatus Bathyarchaeum sp.]|nr:MAG: hypothetical protein CW691_04325 [Candidatus Bathyarchaeum sp.]